MKLKRRTLLTWFGLGSFSGLFGMWAGRTVPPAASPDPAPTATLPEPAKSLQTSGQPLLRFVAVADTGSGDRNQYAVAEAMIRYRQQHPYTIVVLAGDNIYTNGEIWKVGAVFEQPYEALLQQGVQFRACLGNHDIRTDNGDPQVQYANFHMQGRYYTFREQSVQFFALDTNHNANWSAQLAWLEQELRRSDARWKIAFGHHPIYSSGHYGSDRTLIETLTPLFKRYNVALYINGHEHSYERTRLIAGTTYLVTGIGGAYLRPVAKSEWTEFSVMQHGFSAIELYPDRLEIQGIGTDGSVFDRGVVQI